MRTNFAASAHGNGKTKPPLDLVKLLVKVVDSILKLLGDVRASLRERQIGKGDRKPIRSCRRSPSRLKAPSRRLPAPYWRDRDGKKMSEKLKR